MSPGAGSPGLGEAWETRAAEFLTSQGLAIITRRYRCRLGELVVVEVKARARTGSALPSVDSGKRRRIVNATRHFLMRHDEWHPRPIRFDVIAFEGIDSDHPRIRWIRNAFEAA